YSLDGTTFAHTNNTNTLIAQELISFNVIEHIIRKFGESVFGNARTLAERVAWVKAGNVAKLNVNWSGFGSGPLGNKATLACWSQSAWVTFSSNTASIVTKTIASMTTASPPGWLNAPYAAIDNNGFFHALVYS